MKSPLGSIVRAGNTADRDANANITTSFSASAGDLSQLSSTNNNPSGLTNELSEADKRALARKQALEEAKKPPPLPPEETPDFSKATPKSRSDAVAAAKRRTEERRKTTSATTKAASPAKSAKPTELAITNNANANANANATNQMEWFNLLGPMANPSGHDPSCELNC